MIHLIGGYYMTADKNAYTVGEVAESGHKRYFKPGARYYPTLERPSLIRQKSYSERKSQPVR